RPRRGQAAQVDRGRTEAQIPTGEHLRLEVDALDERVLGDHDVAADPRRVVGNPADESAALELAEQPELAEVGQPHRSASPKTSTGPSPAPFPARPAGPASEAAWAAPLAAASSSKPRASSAASIAECVHPAPCVAATVCRGTGMSTSRSPS